MYMKCNYDVPGALLAFMNLIGEALAIDVAHHRRDRRQGFVRFFDRLVVLSV